jgi:hypothetical protein
VHRKLPGVPLEIRPDRAITLRLDRRGRRRRADGPFGRAVHRVAGGERPDLVGWWIELPAGISIDEPAPTGPIDANGEPGETYLDGYLAGIAEERARWEEWLASGPPDTGAGPAVAIAEDAGIGKGLG